MAHGQHPAAGRLNSCLVGSRSDRCDPRDQASIGSKASGDILDHLVEPEFTERQRVQWRPELLKMLGKDIDISVRDRTIAMALARGPVRDLGLSR
jgi:hypothetical protein